MEGEKGAEQNMGANEVVVVISGVEESKKFSSVNTQIPQVEEKKQSLITTTGYSSPEITNLSPAVKKSTTSPDGSVRRRRLMASSAYSKPKSRLVEPSLYKNSPASKIEDSSTPKESVRTAPITPRTPLMTSLIENDDEEEEGEEDSEVYKTGYLHNVDEKKEGKKFKVMFLIELIEFVCIMVFLIASLSVNKLQKSMVWSLEVWKWCVLVLVIFCGRLVTEWCSNVLVFLFERNFIMKKKVLYFVYSLKNCVRILIWLGLVLMAWGLLINRGVRRSRKTTRNLNYVTRALGSSLIGAGMWTLKTLFVKVLASSFHVKRFFDRIQEAIFHQYVVQTLSGPPLMEYDESVDSARTSGTLSFRSVQKGKKVEKEEVIDVEKLNKMKKEKISAWTMGGLIKLVRTSGLSTISDTLEESADDEVVEQKGKQITCEWEAKAAAYRIFKNVAKLGSRHIDEDDLLRFMKMEEVDNVLPLFEGAEQTGKIKMSSFCNWVVNVYNERKYLSHSLNDTKTAIEALNRIVSGITLIVIIIVWLLLMGLATTKVLVFITSQLLLAVFMFGNTCRTTFEALVFVFVMHPFDVGDRCVIDGTQMVVEEMNILTTIFLRYDNEKIFYPNSVLATKPISNFNRSPEMSDSVAFAVDVSTSVESIVALKAKIKAYLESKPQHWRPAHSVQVKEIEDVNKMKMCLNVTHTINFQNHVERSNRRSELVFELKKIFLELGIKYNLLPQEVHIAYIGSPAP